MAPRRRTSGSGIEGLASEFEDLPLIAAPIAAAFVLLLAWLVPMVLTNLPSHTAINYSLLFAPLVRVIGVLMAAAILLFGPKGAASRALDRWVSGRRSRQAFQRASGQPGTGSMTWFDLELGIGEAYKRLGYQVVRRGGPHADGGVDLELRRADERVLVQCKYWKTWQVGVRPVRELWGVVAAEGATRAIFVTTGGYSAAARAFASDKAIELLDGAALTSLITAARHASESPAVAASDVTCPRCGRPMALRTARHGTHTGEQFYGCTGYPDCRQILPSRPGQTSKASP